ncbi:RAMP superfamily CRISPR-associated protein [Anthocerotibacter panamensis]|uniref:RAMP superfamily CRISPR-associated protein n=1 Tax=Anthocerotibacter panamensis TaxID=2857077 RepID=UPI001C406F25|nr:RAMP superfamily CRISPR-associated protein [Anthocerotibacter panamensis]
MIRLQELTTNPVISLPITAIIDTALCVGAGGSSGSLADKPILRNAQGQLLIPASQLKGRLRHECEKLARGLGWVICGSPVAGSMCPKPRSEGTHCFICQIFGNPVLPSRVIFDDLVCTIDLKDYPEVLRPGVTINRARRTAEDQKLYFLETSPANTGLEFSAEIHLLPEAPTYTQALLCAGLKHIHALGGSKSTGLGWLQWKRLPKPENAGVWQELLPGGAA